MSLSVKQSEIEEEIRKIEGDIRVEYPDVHLGFMKSLEDRIVVLEILGETNEDREDIADKNYAIMRCSKAKVLEIYDMHDRSKTFDEASSSYGTRFKYENGKIVESSTPFDPDLSKIDTSGIHYFLSLEPPYFWFHHLKNGLCKSWYENGQLCQQYTRKNDVMHGWDILWHKNGQLKTRNKWTCDNENIYCDFEDFYDNGTPYRKGSQIGIYNRRYDGKYEEWYENGNRSQLCNYKDGVLDGPYQVWYENGQMRWDFNYKNGSLCGVCKSWYDDGQKNKKRTYSDNFPSYTKRIYPRKLVE